MALYPLIRPLIFSLEAERAHGLTLAALKMLPAGEPKPHPRLAVRVAGLDFPNPIGLAAGFDKNAEAFGQALRLGFGFAEVGTLTPRPQPGNAKPRLFRLAEDRAVINRMGFNNDGLEAAKRRLQRQRHGIVGVNIGANKDSAAGQAAIADYSAGVRAMAPLADYLTVNISSPNTPGLRALQDKGALDDLLGAVIEARGGTRPPIFLKLAPDLEPADIDDIAEVSIARGIDALIVANTTVSRPPLKSRWRSEAGGLSGAPLAPLALQRLKDFRAATGGRMALIAAGGIGSGADAYERIRAGASLVQIYTALVFEGPGLVRRIVREFDALLRRDGFAKLADAVGTG
jgi:dihydroorotate dehydrogenase